LHPSSQLCNYVALVLSSYAITKWRYSLDEP